MATRLPEKLAKSSALLTGWGRSTRCRSYLYKPASIDELQSALSASLSRGAVARGAGRSYGDAAQNSGGLVVQLHHICRTLKVDAASKRAQVGAAVTLAELLEASLPRGLFVPVVPGTALVTVGGCIAADVHGKNHHRDGSFGCHLQRIRVLTPNGLREGTRNEDRSLFEAVVGGMGLAGIVLEAHLSLIPIRSRFVIADTHRTADLEETMSLMDVSDDRYRYSVAWVDYSARGRRLGRSVVQFANHPDDALEGEPPLSTQNGALASPLLGLPGSAGRAQATREGVARVSTVLGCGLGFPPKFERGTIEARTQASPLEEIYSLLAEAVSAFRLVRPSTVRVFNGAWYRKAPDKVVGAPVPLGNFFFPLDAISGWNRLYGKTGFLQYQFLVPFGAEKVIERALLALRRIRAYSPVTVLKRMGRESGFALSFPSPGWTLAVDLPSWIPDLHETLARLDREVADFGGRVYLAKDARLRPEVLPTMYPRLNEWRSAVAQLDPNGVLISDLDRRLGLKDRTL